MDSKPIITVSFGIPDLLGSPTMPPADAICAVCGKTGKEHTVQDLKVCAENSARS